MHMPFFTHVSLLEQFVAIATVGFVVKRCPLARFGYIYFMKGLVILIKKDIYIYIFKGGG